MGGSAFADLADDIRGIDFDPEPSARRLHKVFDLDGLPLLALHVGHLQHVRAAAERRAECPLPLSKALPIDFEDHVADAKASLVGDAAGSHADDGVAPVRLEAETATYRLDEAHLPSTHSTYHHGVHRQSYTKLQSDRSVRGAGDVGCAHLMQLRLGGHGHGFRGGAVRAVQG